MTHESPPSTSLIRRLLIGVLVIVVLASAITASVSYYMISSSGEAQLGARADEYLANLTRSLEIPLWGLDEDQIQAIGRIYMDSDLIDAVTVSVPHGEEPIYTATKSGAGNTLQRSGDVVYAGQAIGRVALTLTTAPYDEQLNGMLTNILTTALLASLLIALLGGGFLRFLLDRPLAVLNSGINEIAAGHYDAQFGALREEELAGIAESFKGMARQVQERELELRRLRNYLHNIVNSMPSVLVGVDATGRVTQWNLEAERVTGVPAATAQGQPLGRIFPALQSEMQRVRAAIRRREVQSQPKRPVATDGETQYQDITIYPLISNGVEGAVIRIDNVTERVQLELMMIQSEKMLSVGGLAAGTAHEINNPLAGILQNAQVLRNRLDPRMPRNAEAAQQAGTTMEAIADYARRRDLGHMIEVILESGQRAARIVDNMLSFARMTTTGFAQQDLAELLDKTVELAESDYDLKKHYDFRRIEIVREYDPRLPQVPCQSSMIQQVFLNLLKNGAQAMAEHSAEPQRQPRFVLRIAQLDGYARVEIEDNGPGMSEAVRQRVFEPFYTTKDVGVGTGLGLSVSYFIVTETHKGIMEVRSQPGQGSTFVVQLPLTQVNPPLLPV